MRGRGSLTLAVAAVLFAHAGVASAQPVTGLSAKHQDGFTTLRWNPVPDATDYQIERTPVDASNAPTGAATIVGVWQPQRTITPDKPAFAESGYTLGERFQWRVRARIGTTAQEFSEPVFGTTLPQWGSGPGAGLRTQYETAGDGTYTSDVNEYAYEAALDQASERVRMVEIARTLENRAVNMLIIGYPAPPATARAISDRPTYAINCNVHGNEPSGREACLIMARELAFTTDPRMLDILSRITVLLVPSINADGRAHNTRGNTTGQDLNRDYAEITQNETKGFVAMLRDYTPEVLIDAHEGDSEDLPILTARHLNVPKPFYDEGKEQMVEGWMYANAAESGWWMGPYSTGGDSHEGILRNTGALKNTLSMLGEARGSGGVTRPAETGNTLANRNRKVYAHLWENYEGLEYYDARRSIIHNLVQASIAHNVSNTGPVVLRGSWPWPYNPLNGANTGLPDVDAVTSDHIVDPPPCGYFLTPEQYQGANPDGTVAERLALHGIAVEAWPNGYLVRMAQPQRGLIAPILDGASVSPSPMVAATRLYDCPSKSEGTVGGTVPATLSLTLAGPASFGAFVPGVEADYTAETSASVISTAGDAALSVSGPDHLTNGAFTLPEPFTVELSKSSWTAPVSNDVVDIAFRQHIGANDPLRTGTYSATVTFTLSTTNP
jgi:predicted deacylase